MAKTVKVPALCDFTYNGRQVAKGDVVEMGPLEAAAHARQQHVTLAKGAYLSRALTVGAKAPAPPDPEAVTASRRRYRRRDLQAED